MFKHQLLYHLNLLTLLHSCGWLKKIDAKAGIYA